MRYGGAARLATLTVVLAGCVDNDISFSINRFIAPSNMAGSTGCLIDPAVEVSLPRGVYDVDMARYTGLGYFVNFVVSNNLRAVANQPVSTQIYYISAYDVELEPEGAVASAIPVDRRSFSYRSSTLRLEPGAEAAGTVEAIPPDLIAAIGALAEPIGLISARVRAVGTRAEQENVSAFASFPIQLCKGCVGNTDASGALPACPLPKGSAVLSGNPCNPAQDNQVVCCTSGTTLVCPATVSAM